MSTSTKLRATLREGIALPLALAAIVVVGALITGVFFAATQEYRVGRSSVSAQRTVQAAEAGLTSVIASWDVDRTNRTKVGRSDSLADTTIDQARVKRRYSRVAPHMFWVTVTASPQAAGFDNRAVKRLNAIMRVQTPEFPIMGAITSRGKTEVAGATKISGTDTVPQGWDCPPGAGQVAGVVVNDSATNYTKASADAVVTGTPAVKDSTAMVRDTMTFTEFGGLDYWELAAKATKVRTGGGKFATIGPKYRADGITCDRDHVDNWGEQSLTDGNAGCADFFPVVHLQGDNVTYTLDGGPGGSGGQGILLVDGHLNIAGRFAYTGLILVRGRIRITGSMLDGPRVVGAVAAMNRTSPDSTNLIAGGSITAFSSCVLNQVASRIATIQPLQHRGWADLSF